MTAKEDYAAPKQVSVTPADAARSNLYRYCDICESLVDKSRYPTRPASVSRQEHTGSSKCESCEERFEVATLAERMGNRLKLKGWMDHYQSLKELRRADGSDERGICTVCHSRVDIYPLYTSDCAGCGNCGSCVKCGKRGVI